MRVCEPLAGQLGLPLAEASQRCLHLALEALLDDELGLAVPEQHQDRVEAFWNERSGP